MGFPNMKEQCYSADSNVKYNAFESNTFRNDPFVKKLICNRTDVGVLRNVRVYEKCFKREKVCVCCLVNLFGIIVPKSLW